MTHQEIRDKFIKFFSAKGGPASGGEGHKIVPSSSLLPTDPSVLFTTAGMQQFKPYYTSEADPLKDFGSLNTASIQKCLRTSDIDEVGDESHLTFFEMLGNFSFGGYFKKEAIQYAHEFITKVMGLKIDYVSVFGGEKDVPADTESEAYWKEIDPNIEVRKFGRADNFWGPTGDEGPCGPTSEIYVNGVEIWNLVFNQYYQSRDGTLEPLKTPGIDTGMGLERLAMISQGKENIFETDLLAPLISILPQDMDIRARRIIADHARAITLLISDNVVPSNKERGYVLRKLIRRMMTYSYLYLTRHSHKVVSFNYEDVIEVICKQYESNFENIRNIVRIEYTRFNDALGQGVVVLKKVFNRFIGGIDPQNLGSIIISNNTISGKGLGIELFNIYQSQGLHPDIARDILQQWGLILDESVVKEYTLALEQEKITHQELSRTASAGMFKGGLADTSEQTTRLHTAAHLMLAGLRKVLGSQVSQKGSNITPERLRFDFNYDDKMTPEQIKQVEDFVNDAIYKKLPVRFEEVTLDEARAMDATGAFDSKYGERIKVYIIGDGDDTVSKEICGGPHVTNTGKMGKFKIIKEESVSAGTRRIRATVE